MSNNTNIPDEKCGAKLKVNQNVDQYWVCRSCYEKIDPEPEVYPIPKMIPRTCIICGNDADTLVASIGNCNSVEFMKVYRFRRISAIVSPTGREHIIQIEFNKCLKCGAVKVIKQ